MAHEAGSIGLPAGLSSVDTIGPPPPGILRLVASVVIIASSAVAFACLLAAAFVLFLYFREGTDGVAEFYQDFRFDRRLQTLISAVVVGALYVGVAASTLLLARRYGRRHWPSLVAWSPVGAPRLLILLIVVTTLAYGAAATLAMTHNHRVIVAGNTDLALLLTLSTNLVLLAPLAEELLFRGWLYTGLRARLPFWATFVATSALFAAIHGGTGRRRILLVFPLAAALGVLREVTGSIKPTMVLHSVYNLVIISLTLLEI